MNATVRRNQNFAMPDPTAHDWPKLVDELNRLLRLKTTPIGMKLFERVEDMQAVPKLRRPKAIHTTDQIVAQAARLGFTIGITRDDHGRAIRAIPAFVEGTKTFRCCGVERLVGADGIAIGELQAGVEERPAHIDGAGGKLGPARLFGQHDFAFAFDCGGLEAGTVHHLGEDVEGPVE